MKSLINKVLTTAVVISVGGGIFNLDSVSAATIGYDLRFFNDSGNEVGLGEFSYDPDTTTCIPEIPIDESCQFSGLLVTTELTDFSANISGTEWRLRDSAGQHWWDEATSTVKGASITRSGILLQDQWFFGDQFFAENLLAMSGTSGGSWIQVLDTTNFLSGTWTAQLQSTTSPGGQIVPEPLTILGAGVAIGFGAFFKKKLK